MGKTTMNDEKDSRRIFIKTMGLAMFGAAVSRGSNVYADPSTAKMFRGNSSHTSYGWGKLSENPSIKWQYQMGGYVSKKSGKTWSGTGWTGTAVVHKDSVFIGSLDSKLYCFNRFTGKVKWIFKAREMFKSSAAYFAGRIFIGNVDNHLYCINAENGDLLWKYNTEQDLDSSPVISKNRLYIAGECGWMHCIRPDTGNIIWRTFLDGTEGKPGSNGVETSPAVWNGRVYAANYSGELFCLSAYDGTILWKANTGDDTDVSPVVQNGIIYIASEEKSPYVFAFDAYTGKRIWRFGGRFTGGFWSTPAVKDGKVYIGDFASSFYCLDGKTGKVIWKNKMKRGVWSSPALVDGKVVYGSYDSRLYLVDEITGKVLSRRKLHGRIISSPVVADGHIYVGTATGMFYCLK
jgi:eukaryotic-like serine/threonine-protein kinase